LRELLTKSLVLGHLMIRDALARASRFLVVVVLEITVNPVTQAHPAAALNRPR